MLVFRPEHHRAHQNGYVRRCILVAEQKIGRRLEPKEVVHHINQVRDDDRPENLQVLESQSVHIAGHNRGMSRARALTFHQVRDICAVLGKEDVESIAIRFGVASPTIWSIWRRETWRKTTDGLVFPEAPAVWKQRTTKEQAKAILQAPDTETDRELSLRIGVKMNTIRGVRFRHRHGLLKRLA